MAVDFSPTLITDGMKFNLDFGSGYCYSPNAFPAKVSTNLIDWQKTATRINCTIVRDGVNGTLDTGAAGTQGSPSPVGQEPLRMQITGIPAYVVTEGSASWNIMPAVAGDVITLSVYMKSSPNNLQPRLLIMEANSSGVPIVGALSQIGIRVTSQWTRYSITRTLTNASTAFVQIRLDGDYDVTSGYIWFDGVQVERSSSATRFNLNNTNNGISANNKINDMTPFATASQALFENRPSFSDTFGQGSLTLNGVNQNIGVEGKFVPSGTDPFTLSYWLYFDGNVSGNFAGKKSAGMISGDGTLGGFEIFLQTANTTPTAPTFFTMGRYGQAPTGSFDVSITMPIQQWHNLVVVRDGVASQKLYLNNVLVGTGNISNSYPVVASGQIGGLNYNPTFSSYFNGKFANLAFYNRALSPVEIDQNFQSMRRRFGV
jgi:hypothetical protein